MLPKRIVLRLKYPAAEHKSYSEYISDMVHGCSH